MRIKELDNLLIFKFNLTMLLLFARAFCTIIYNFLLELHDINSNLKWHELRIYTAYLEVYTFPLSLKSMTYVNNHNVHFYHNRMSQINPAFMYIQ